MSGVEGVVTEALREHQRVAYGRCRCGWAADVINIPCNDDSLAAHQAAAVMAALHSQGYTVMRPVTAEEEARNDW